MVTEAQFSEALQKVPDNLFKDVIDYIDSGNTFLYGNLGAGSGKGCIIGVMMAFHKVHGGILEKRSCFEAHIKFGCDRDHLVDYNNMNNKNPRMYQLILAEAERRGMKPELEMEKVIA